MLDNASPPSFASNDADETEGKGLQNPNFILSYFANG